jgi:autotransporter-associated beta strand protein
MDNQRTKGEVPGSSRSVDRRRSGNDRFTTVVLVLFAGVWFGTSVAHAQVNATWEVSAPSPPGEETFWNNPGNWTAVPPVLPPMVPTGTATFSTFGSSVVTFSPGANTVVGALQFISGAQPYSFSLNGTSFTINGAGILNGSTNFPEFVATVVATTLNFEGSSTAGNAQIVGNSHLSTNFEQTSTAGDATISNFGGGSLTFMGTSTADNSTILTGMGSTTFFKAGSTGDKAALIAFAGGIFDLSYLTSTGMTAGSIEGPGTFFLGSKALTVGLNNFSTTVTGIIADGGGNGGKGGSLIKVGTGILTLSGTSTYTGPTTVSGGTLQAGSTKGFSPNSAFIVNSSLDLNGFSNTVGSLAGNGIVSNIGSPQDTIGKQEKIPLLPAILTAGGNGTNTVFSGILSDGFTSLGLTKTGTGTTTLSGINTYTGGTIVNAGTLMVASAQALGLGDVTVNGGVLSADPRPINVKGNYTQGAGGTLQLQVAGANPGQYDSLNVSGNASLGGTLQLISLGFQPKAGNELTLVTTGGVVSGRFAQFVNPFATGPTFPTADLVYGRNSVLLEFLSLAVVPVSPVVVTTDFSSFAFTPNQSASASLLDAVQLDPRAANLISFLNTEPFSNLTNDLEKISPDGLTAFYEISFSNANIQKLNLESRLDDIHNGSNGFSSNMKVNGATVNLENGADADGKSSKAVVEPVLQHAPENRWGVWVTGFGDFVDVDGDGNAQGYNFTTGGVSLGIDYRITDQLAIGAFGEYSHTWTDLNPGGHIDVDSGRGGVYATWFSHGIYINGAIYGGHNTYDSGRAGLGGLANGSTEGSEWSTFIGGGYDFHFGPLTVGPIASLQYTDVGVDSFDEKGSLAPLAIHSGSAESLRSDAGFRAFYQWQIGKMVVEPSVKAAWEHEYKYSALPITAGFAGIPGPSATFLGPSEGHDSAVVSAGVSLQLTSAISTYVNYDGELGRGNYDSNAVTGGVRISF